MKANVLSKYEVYIPYLGSLLFFLTCKLEISSRWYLFFAILSGIYFFPVRLITSKVFEEKILRVKIAWFLSSFLLADIMGCSCIFLYINNIEVLRTIMIVFSLLNVLFLAWYFFMDKKIKLFLLHFGFLILSAVVPGK